MDPSLPAHVDLKKLREIFAAVAKRRIRNEVDAEEIVQEALATVLEKSSAQSFEKSFLQWAFGVLRNKIGNYYQKRDRRVTHEGELDEGTMRTQADTLPDPLDRCAESELKGKIRKAWQGLGVQCRRLLWLLYQGYSREDIFQAFPQYHFKVINTKIFRCRNYLKRLLRKEGYEL
jgi:RNA polymerase sigma factor (sigma-70 family)